MIEISKDTMRLILTIVFALVIAFSLVVMGGCSSIQIPENTQVLEFDSPSEYPPQFQKWQAYTVLLDDGALIYTIIGNECLLEHEIKHVTDGAGHDGWPKRLMECRV